MKTTTHTLRFPAPTLADMSVRVDNTFMREKLMPIEKTFNCVIDWEIHENRLSTECVIKFILPVHVHLPTFKRCIDNEMEHIKQELLCD